MTKRSLISLFGPRYWLTWIGFAIFRIISLLPLPVLAMLGSLFGLLYYYLVPSRRKIAFTNISSCFPDWSARRVSATARKNFLLAGQQLCMTGVIWWSSNARLNRLVSLHNSEQYERLVAAGRNIIILAPHFLPLEVGGIFLNQYRPMVSMYQYNKSALVDEIILRGRTRFGGDVVERKEPLRKLLKMIRRGLPFYYLPDQDAGRKGIFVPFFNELASTVPMLGKFAQMGDAVVIPCRNEIRSWGRGFKVILYPAIEDFPSADEQRDTIIMNCAIEEMVKDCPEQYFWAHKRFKTRPEGEAKFYK